MTRAPPRRPPPLAQAVARALSASTRALRALQNRVPAWTAPLTRVESLVTDAAVAAAAPAHTPGPRAAAAASTPACVPYMAAAFGEMAAAATSATQSQASSEGPQSRAAPLSARVATAMLSDLAPLARDADEARLVRALLSGTPHRLFERTWR